MGFGNLIRLINTLKHLKFKQVYYRVYYIIRNKYFSPPISKTLTGETAPINWQLYEISTQESVNGRTFSFLNQSKFFSDKIDWNYANYGKLWTYNLNYFDFLNQKEISKEHGIELILDYIANDDVLKDGKEPYPISLRGINWIKFLSKNKIVNPKIDKVLYNHYQMLSSNLEYHLLANHLLENGFSLLFGAYYFQDEKLYHTAVKILKEELEEQILNDGGHFELSPMYHQILLHRVLDCISLVSQNSWQNREVLHFLKEKALNMLSWLHEVTFKNGNIPMVNDSAYDIAPSSSQLFEYAKSLDLTWNGNQKLSDSGYRKFITESYELFIDIGNIQPPYQPGHTHSDTFNFELYYKETPIFVDTGISTYEKNELRQTERETSSHNTVQIANYEQSDVWGGFRVGRRAKIVDFQETSKLVKASHNGYKKYGFIHERSFENKDNEIMIVDKLSKPSNQQAKAYFHLHPSINNIKINKNSITLNSNIELLFAGCESINLENYNYAIGFNKTKSAKQIIVKFDQTLETKISL
ncbi:alginate lyase family protein [Flavobacteriaceae sp. LMIT009]